MNRSRRLIASGLATGLGGGLASLGGGTILIPLLTEWLGMDQLEARGTAMATSGFTALSGALSYGLHGSVDWRTLLWTGLPALVCAPLAARISSAWPQPLLRRLFGIVMLFGALALIVKDTESGGFASAWPLAWLLLVGVIAGSVAGIVGVSGGPVLAPLFVLGLGMPQALAQGSSLLARIPAIAGGVAENMRENAVSWRSLPLLAPSVITGTVIGSILAIHLPARGLHWLFAGLLVLLGLHELGNRPLQRHISHRPHGSYP